MLNPSVPTRKVNLHLSLSLSLILSPPMYSSQACQACFLLCSFPLLIVFLPLPDLDYRGFFCNAQQHSGFALARVPPSSSSTVQLVNNTIFGPVEASSMFQGRDSKEPTSGIIWRKLGYTFWIPSVQNNAWLHQPEPLRVKRGFHPVPTGPKGGI